MVLWSSICFLLRLAIACKLIHSAAADKIKGAGIGISSSGGCFNRNQASCTSLDQINCNAISCMVALKKSSGCSLTITGGTVSIHNAFVYVTYVVLMIDLV
jgi:hypothetical protein